MSGEISMLTGFGITVDKTVINEQSELEKLIDTSTLTVFEDPHTDVFIITVSRVTNEYDDFEDFPFGIQNIVELDDLFDEEIETLIDISIKLKHTENFGPILLITTDF